MSAHNLRCRRVDRPRTSEWVVSVRLVLGGTGGDREWPGSGLPTRKEVYRSGPDRGSGVGVPQTVTVPVHTRTESGPEGTPTEDVARVGVQMFLS